MIARLWHGKTAAQHIQAYSRLLEILAIPDYRETPGFRELRFLRSTRGDEAHFLLLSFWEDLEAIKNFAGPDYEKAKYYPEDKEYLLEFEETVQHWEVFAAEGSEEP